MKIYYFLCLTFCFSISFANSRPIVSKLLPTSSSSSSSSSDFDISPWNSFVSNSSSGLQVQNISFIIPSTKRHFNGFLATIDNPAFFTYALPAQGCGHKAVTSQTAAENNCQFATNAGFFDVPTGNCIGNIIINSTVIQTSDSLKSSFGMLASKQFISGYLSHQDLTNSSLQFTQLLSGSGWLVRNGVSYIAKSAVIEGLDSNFVTEKAPRTCIGNFPNGTLAIFEVDGEEDIKTGVGLAEFAEILVILGVSNAINLDGGGSSTVYYNGTVIDLPTCNDTPIICEREVTTITCVKSSL